MARPRVSAVRRGIYVQNLTTGAGASWNAGAAFPAASTLKLAIARHRTRAARRDATARIDARRAAPTHALVLRQRGGQLAGAVLRRLDERWLGARERAACARSGSSTPTCTAVTSSARGARRGAGDPGAGRGASRYWGIGKRTTALRSRRACTCGLARRLGHGPLRRAYPRFTPSDAATCSTCSRMCARRARSPARCTAFPVSSWRTRPAGSTAHATTPVSSFWRGGVFVVAVMTYRPSAPVVRGRARRPCRGCGADPLSRLSARERHRGAARRAAPRAPRDGGRPRSAPEPFAWAGRLSGGGGS